MVRFLLPLLVLLLSAPAWAETRVPQNQMEIQLGFAPLVKQAAPAVVNIYAKRVVQTRQSPFADDPFFRNFFNDFGKVQPKVQNSLGSGVILSADGYVVSNYHVVGGATDIRVVLNDRREFAADVVLSDEDSDLAILKLREAPDMPFLDLRNSDSVEVGELVLAIGNPFGIGQTVSSGIVSGLARSGIATGSARGYFLQTDAAINPGNSGGALIDVNGQLIGVNTSILTRSGGSNGVGFAIPANLVAQFVSQARGGQRQFQRPWAGMIGQSLDTDIAENLGFDRPGGVLISALHGASPFRKAGVRAGDVILEVNGQPVNTPAEMLFHMSVAGLGTELGFVLFRDGEALGGTLELIAAPEEPSRATLELPRSTALPGLVVSQVNPAVIAQYGLSLAAEGVVVETPGPYAAQVGLQPGDILLGVNGAEIREPEDVSKALSRKMRVLNMDVLRGGKRVVLRIRL